MNIERVAEFRCTVGEGPVWDVKTQSLFFVDLVGQTLWRYRPATGEQTSWSLPLAVAGFSLTEQDQGLVVLVDGFYAIDLDTGALTQLARPDLGDGTQLNDVKVDPQGRMVAVGMSRIMRDPDAGLFVLDGASVRSLDDDYIIGNGPCWSPDGSKFYCADTVRSLIYVYDYDQAKGAVSNRRVFASTGTEGGMPDGATIDRDGRLWIAMLGAGTVVVYSPEGQVERRVEMPTKWVASVMFGGPDLDQLYVTSLDPSVAGQQPDAGATFVYRVDGLGAVGLPEPRARAF